MKTGSQFGMTSDIALHLKETLASIMILEWHWLAIIGFITMILGMYAVWKTEFQGPAAGIQARMRDFAKQAVAEGAKDYQSKLDFSTSSIEQIDRILDTFSQRHQTDPIPEKELSQIVLTWGAYVGISLIKQVGGTWHVSSQVAGANTYPILYEKPKIPRNEKRSADKLPIAEAVPVIWCLKRIRHGAKESVAAKYREAIQE